MNMTQRKYLKERVTEHFGKLSSQLRKKYIPKIRPAYEHSPPNNQEEEEWRDDLPAKTVNELVTAKKRWKSAVKKFNAEVEKKEKENQKIRNQREEEIRKLREKQTHLIDQAMLSDCWEDAKKVLDKLPPL